MRNISPLTKSAKSWPLCLFFVLIKSANLHAQTPTPAEPPSYFLNAGAFISPAMQTGYFNPALDLEAGFWKMNQKKFFSWGASAEAWEFSSVEYMAGSPEIKNNTDGFINLNSMFFLQNNIITPYVAPSVSLATDFENSGFTAGLALGLNHQTSDRLQTFVQLKYTKFTTKLDYLDMKFYMIGLSLKLAKSASAAPKLMP